MSHRTISVAVLSGWLLTSAVVPVWAEPAAQTTTARKVRVTGVVRDDSNNISLPGIPVEVAGGETVYTDVDGRYVLDLAPGSHELRVTMDGYEARSITVEVAAGSRAIDANVGLQMSRFAETVTGHGGCGGELGHLIG